MSEKEIKNFDKWNELKKKIDKRDIKNIFLKEGQVWWGHIGENVGYEISGKGEMFERPVLIFKKKSPNTVFVIPLSRKNKNNNNFELSKDSFLVFNQARIIDIRRLNRKHFTLSKDIFKEVYDKYFSLFNVNRKTSQGGFSDPEGLDTLNIANQNKKSSKNVNNQEENFIDDVSFEELNADGEVMSEKEKAKLNKNNLEEKYKEKIEKLEKEKQEYLSGWQRALSDYKNLSNKVSDEKKEWNQMAIKDFIEELFPVLDTYDAARSNISAWESVDQNWRVGIEYIFDLFKNKLSERGIEKFGEVCDIYDANLYEAVENIETDDENKNHKVSQVIASGYKYNGKLLRAAKVKVWVRG